MAEAKLTLQLVLHAGETLETGDGRSVRLDEAPQALEVSGWIRHHGWTLKLSAPARLTWPVHPYNPYRNAPESDLEHAVGDLTTDLLARESERGSFQARLNSDRDAYMWLEAYRVLEPKLGSERHARWRRELERNIAELAADSAERADFPGYQSPFIGTSPNPLSLW